MNRTAQALEKLFEASRRRQQKKKEAAKEAYRKASESIKRVLDSKLSTKQEEQPQDVRKWHLEVYRTKYIERCPSDDELYQTREQLKEAEARGEGKLNWDTFDKLIKKTKHQLYEKERKRTTTREVRMLSNDV